EVEQSEIFIGRMDYIRIQTESHQNRFRSQFFFKQSHNRNTSATSRSQSFFSKSLRHRFFRCLESFVGSRQNVSLSAVVRRNFYFNRRRSKCREIICK